LSDSPGHLGRLAEISRWHATATALRKVIDHFSAFVVL
jgi:hypothetical protein